LLHDPETYTHCENYLHCISQTSLRSEGLQDAQGHKLDIDISGFGRNTGWHLCVQPWELELQLETLEVVSWMTLQQVHACLDVVSWRLIVQHHYRGSHGLAQPLLERQHHRCLHYAQRNHHYSPQGALDGHYDPQKGLNASWGQVCEPPKSEVKSFRQWPPLPSLCLILLVI
jgi:hypothetical protein